jgi:hypothetical protein
LSVSVIEARLREICDREGLKVELESLRMVARLADGSMRDAQTLLDRVQSFCTGEITAEETSRALGTVEQRALLELAQGIMTRDVVRVLAIVSDLFSTGIDPSSLLREFVNFWREVFIAKLGGEARLRAVGVSDDAMVDLVRLVSPAEAIDIQDLWDMARDGADRCTRSSHTRHAFESLVVRMATRRPVADIAELIGRFAAAEPAKQGRSMPSSVASTSRNVSDSKPVGGAAASVKIASATGGAKQGASLAAAGSLRWDEVLSLASERVGKVLLENLKRLAVGKLDVGIFEATGPEFTVNSINQDKQKLVQLLNGFLDTKGIAAPNNWKVVVTKAQGAVDTVASDRAKMAAQGEALGAHPAVQSLQKVFPGSKVEQVRVKSS